MRKNRKLNIDWTDKEQVKKYRKEYTQRPEVKEYNKKYKKKYMREYRKRPKAKKYYREYIKRIEVKERCKIKREIRQVNWESLTNEEQLHLMLEKTKEILLQ